MQQNPVNPAPTHIPTPVQNTTPTLTPNPTPNLNPTLTPTPQKKQNPLIKILVIVGVVLILAVIGVLGFMAMTQSQSPIAPEIIDEANPDEMVACTMDAKICPDGSAVGRSGPNCEFAPCPTSPDSSTQNDGWKVYDNPELKLSFEHPSDWKIVTFDNNPRMVQLTSPDANALIIQLAYAVCTDRSTLEEIPCDSSFEATKESARIGYEPGYKESPIVVDGINGVSFSGIAKDTVIPIKVAYVPVGEYYFQVVMQNEDTQNIFDKIVSTLHFIQK